MVESEADRLALIKGVGGEQFDTGRTEMLWGIFDREYYDAVAGVQTIESRRPVITCRSSDVEAHELIKKSVIRRVADDQTFVVKRLEPDGVGMTILVLEQ